MKNPNAGKGVRIKVQKFSHLRDANAGDMRVLLGLGALDKLPDAGMPPRRVDGVLVWVTARSTNPAVSRRRPHRIFAQCTCGASVPVGRLHQHVCKAANRLDEDEKATARAMALEGKSPAQIEEACGMPQEAVAALFKGE